jgi:hypothetical protein
MICRLGAVDFKVSKINKPRCITKETTPHTCKSDLLVVKISDFERGAL